MAKKFIPNPTYEEIAPWAYWIYESRGGKPGSELEDWFEAEAQLIADRKLAGVCGGIAEYLAVDPTAVRVAWAILTIVPGGIVLGVLAYLAAWLIVPDPPLSAPLAAPRPA